MYETVFKVESGIIYFGKEKKKQNQTTVAVILIFTNFKETRIVDV